MELEYSRQIFGNGKRYFHFRKFPGIFQILETLHKMSFCKSFKENIFLLLVIFRFSVVIFTPFAPFKT